MADFEILDWPISGRKIWVTQKFRNFLTVKNFSWNQFKTSWQHWHLLSHLFSSEWSSYPILHWQEYPPKVLKHSCSHPCSCGFEHSSYSTKKEKNWRKKSSNIICQKCNLPCFHKKKVREIEFQIKQYNVFTFFKYTLKCKYRVTQNKICTFKWQWNSLISENMDFKLILAAPTWGYECI